ncbi:MAG: SUMF1/EgtB/PvdO family nonheme iron enzyme [Candidatus Omnitrophica bacterium]|nr:SUMF1/EgtB/PvdO family nonheme iron enzyme [Candidatus Omnitrophota bacterium]
MWFGLVQFVSSPAHANNISVSNSQFTDQNSTADTIKVQFDISWNNSWRDEVNYDAAWVFLKYSTDGGATWSHATLKTSGTTPSDTSVGAGTVVEIIIPTDKKGAFIQRASAGTGILSTTSVQLCWDYATDGVSDADANAITSQVKVFAIEMVYIPQGSFYAGDGSTSDVDAEFEDAKNGTPYTVSSENQIVLGGGGAGSMGNNNATAQNAVMHDDFNDTTSQNLPAAFPKGYNAFYMMKYEITEGQWVGFFNTLTSAQKTTRDITGATDGKSQDGVSYRNTVAWSSGDATTTRPDRACGYLSWTHLCAYADWAALRPMTELEYEKACRGGNAVSEGEYAWGNTTITAAVTISGTENGTETITTSGANCCYTDQTFNGDGDDGEGPLRAGIFATSLSTRTQSGAGYYGAMELSGNIAEHTVSVGTATGRAFTGSHGDGTLTSTSGYEGNATNTDWPGIDGTTSRGVTGQTGSGIRGGDALTTDVSVSYRFLADWQASSFASYGGRCVRTAS